MRTVSSICAALTAAVALTAAIGAHAADSDTVATIGTTKITRGQLEKHVAPQLVEVENQRYEALKNGLDELVANELVNLEAKARNTTPEALVKAEVTDKATPPTDAEVQAVYDQAKDQLGGQTLEQIKPQIVQYIMQSKVQERRSEFIGELKQKHKATIALKPPIVQVETAGRPEKGGGAKAPVTIITFSDYECPFCKRGEDTVAKVMSTYGDKIRLVFRDYPLPMHSNARPAAEAANCAHQQGKFWEYHDKLFNNQSKLQESDFKAYAKELGLDEAKFAKCLSEKPYTAAIDKDLADGAKVGVSGTPAFFINGRMLSGAQPFEAFKEIIDDELAAKGAAKS
jgi:protein-disulfide isomerase